MRRTAIAGSLSILALAALAGPPGAANAAVLIKSFEFKICVTGAKHPDGCKRVDADARLVVSDDAMERFDGQVGHEATIEAIPERGDAPSSDLQKPRRRRQ
jgi:hypothetical protein